MTFYIVHVTRHKPKKWAFSEQVSRVANRNELALIPTSRAASPSGAHVWLAGLRRLMNCEPMSQVTASCEL